MPLQRRWCSERHIAPDRSTRSRDTGNDLEQAVENSVTISTEESARASHEPALFTNAFRPLFLACGAWAIIAVIMWLAMLFGYVELPSRFDPLAWHIHEMLFGFVMAAVGGFLLTAIPNWTNRLPVRGYPLALLTGLWLLGRIACLISADLPAW